MQELPHQSLRESGRETEATASPLQKATKLPHAKLLCPLCLCLSLSVSLSPLQPPPLPLPRLLHCLRWLGTLALLRLWHWLRTSTRGWRMWLCERRWLAAVKTAVNVRKDGVYVLLFVRRWLRQSTILRRARRLTSAIVCSRTSICIPEYFFFFYVL